MNSRSKQIWVWAQLPATGLGNKLSVWARAYVFARHNQLPLVTTGWMKFSLGPFLRRERSKRIYLNYFRKIPFTHRMKVFMMKFSGKSLYNPAPCSKPDDETGCVIFDKYYMDFSDIAPYRREIISGIYGSLHPGMQRKLDRLDVPDIAVHVRRGDFKIAAYLTPVEYYVSVIQAIRLSTGRNLEAVVYSDAEDPEIDALLRLPHTRRASPKADLLDLLEMSKAKVLITAARSTFSYWACFIGNGIAVKNEAEWFPLLRTTDKQAESLEWIMNESAAFTPGQVETLKHAFRD